MIPCPSCYKKFNLLDDAQHCCWQHTRDGAGPRPFLQGALDLIRAADKCLEDQESFNSHIKEAKFYLDRALQEFTIKA